MDATGCISTRRSSLRSPGCETNLPAVTHEPAACVKSCGACRDAAPSDLQYLTDENIAEIGMRCQLLQPRPASRFAVPAGTAMTHIEKMRLQAALQALSGMCMRSPLLLLG